MLRKSGPARREHWEEKHKFEHWYRDHTVYFITARCRDKHPCFESPESCAVFWDRFTHYTTMHHFEPWVTTLMNNHYHTLGFLHRGEDLGPMMRKIHGSVAKLVNDLLPERHIPFWNDQRHRDYFDGCIRSEKQYRRAYQYTLLQSVRAGLATDWKDFEQTRVTMDMEAGLFRAHQMKGFMEGVRYRRYDKPSGTGT